MDFNIEKFISPFIEAQFPSFYQDEGPNFILFVKAYYEWMEEQGNPINEARNLFDYRDIDNTVESFLAHFQKKYLYGIPFNVIINKRFLLKHILDVYRSKGSINCYKLLFRLIYNEDIEVYLPGRDILRASDGTWINPRYLEVTTTSNLADLVGATIVGLSSKVQATVESFISEPINQNIISTLFISNIKPQGGSFIEGEKIIDITYLNSANLASIITNSPTITGSLDSVDIINGGTGFKVGDVLGIVHRDLSNNNIVSYGTGGLVRVTKTTSSQGSLSFNIQRQGFGITNNALTFLYNGDTDTTGKLARFSVGSISNTQSIVYNTDIICNYLDTVIDASGYNFPLDPSANLSSNIDVAFSYTNNIFGSLLSLTGIRTGNGYTQIPYDFIRSVEVSNSLPGTISYNTSSNTITGISTNFTYYFSNNDCINLQANSSNPSTSEYQIIRTVNSDTSITLYGPPQNNSTATAEFRAAPSILPANFALYENTMYSPDSTVNGLNSNVIAYPISGNNVVQTTSAINSGKGYVDGELVQLYLYGGLNTPTILSGGLNYSNNDSLVFTGGGSLSTATGFVTTDANGTIVSTTLSYTGSGYTSIPTISVNSTNGNGAVFSTSINEFNTFSQVLGNVVKSGTGRGLGYWSTTQGFLDSDKYIQDSYFYQDFSYQIKVAEQLNKYKDILYNTFHVAGTALFGQFQLVEKNTEVQSILYEPVQALIS
jgi:hypothetical protein